MKLKQIFTVGDKPPYHAVLELKTPRKEFVEIQRLLDCAEMFNEREDMHSVNGILEIIKEKIELFQGEIIKNK